MLKQTFHIRTKAGAPGTTDFNIPLILSGYLDLMNNYRAGQGSKLSANFLMPGKQNPFTQPDNPSAVLDYYDQRLTWTIKNPLTFNAVFDIVGEEKTWQTFLLESFSKTRIYKRAEIYFPAIGVGTQPTVAQLGKLEFATNDGSGTYKSNNLEFSNYVTRDMYFSSTNPMNVAMDFEQILKPEDSLYLWFNPIAKVADRKVISLFYEEYKS